MLESISKNIHSKDERYILKYKAIHPLFAKKGTEARERRMAQVPQTSFGTEKQKKQATYKIRHRSHTCKKPSVQQRAVYVDQLVNSEIILATYAFKKKPHTKQLA